MSSLTLKHCAALVLFLSTAGVESKAQTRERMALPGEAEMAKHAREWEEAKARNEKLAQTTLHEPPLGDKMHEVESLLRDYVDTLKPAPGFAQRTLQALYELGGRFLRRKRGTIKGLTRARFKGWKRA